MEEYEPNRFKLENPEPGGGGGNQQQTDPCKGPNPPAYCNVGDDDRADTDNTIKKLRWPCSKIRGLYI